MHSSLWLEILSEISKKVFPTTFDIWFRSLSLFNQTTEDALSISAPNQFIADYVEHHYKNLIFTCIKNRTDLIKNIFFNVQGEKKYIAAESRTQNSSFPYMNAEHSPSAAGFFFNKNYSFDSFVVGPGNEFAKSAALAVAKAPGKTKFNPLLIYGGAGLGKTHLLHSIGNYLVSLSTIGNIVYCSSEEFYLNFIDAIKNNGTKQFTDTFRSSRVLLIDDIQFLSGKESTQEEFFYIFNTLYQNQRQIVLTSDLPPSSLLGLQDRLVSRFQWGLCVDIQPPNLETRMAILKRKAEEGNLNIAENIISFIAENGALNIRELEGIIIRLFAYSSITKQDITLDLVKNLLEEKGKKTSVKVSIEEIINSVSAFYKIPVNNIREKNRRKEVALCRQIAMYMVKTLTHYSLKSIGLHFGGRDHSTVIHAINTIEKLKFSDPSIAADINNITDLLRNM
jgi:chromosomal replication initiator protein